MWEDVRKFRSDPILRCKSVHWMSAEMYMRRRRYNSRIDPFPTFSAVHWNPILFQSLIEDSIPSLGGTGLIRETQKQACCDPEWTMNPVRTLEHCLKPGLSDRSSHTFAPDEKSEVVRFLSPEYGGWGNRIMVTTTHPASLRATAQQYWRFIVAPAWWIYRVPISRTSWMWGQILTFSCQFSLVVEWG
jgi:hypothetical protein